MKRAFLYALLLGTFWLIPGCHKKSAPKNANVTIITVAPKTSITALHFSGTLEPLTSQPVLSPIDGRVTHVLFRYGQQIQKDQPVITLDASKLAEDYRKTVNNFLEKKQAYEAGLSSYEGTEALYKAGVISQEEYTTASNRQKSDTLNYYQAKYELEKLLPQTQVALAEIEKLKLSDVHKMSEILNKQFHEIQVTAPATGVALFPTGEQKKENSSGRVAAGDELKAGQLILAIGDLSGFSMKINVSEININLIKPQLPTKVTGDAFPGIVLNGYVESVAAQANPQTGGESGLSLFEVLIKIPSVTTEQQRVIHVGMSAAVELDIPEPSQIYLPIKAVYEKNGQKMVTIVTKTGKKREVPVITGKTTLTEVAIVRGINPGDHVVVPY